MSTHEAGYCRGNGTNGWLTGAKGVEYPTRFFARDYAGNRLEFTL